MLQKIVLLHYALLYIIAISIFIMFNCITFCVLFMRCLYVQTTLRQCISKPFSLNHSTSFCSFEESLLTSLYFTVCLSVLFMQLSTRMMPYCWTMLARRRPSFWRQGKSQARLTPSLIWKSIHHRVISLEMTFINVKLSVRCNWSYLYYSHFRKH